MAQAIDNKAPYETVPGGGGASVDWEDPVNGPYEWERNGWSQSSNGLWYHPSYGTLGFLTPPAPNSRGGGGPGGSGGNVGPGGLEKFPVASTPTRMPYAPVSAPQSLASTGAGASHFMGMDPATWIWLAGMVAPSVMGALSAPDQQERQSYAGTHADPVDWLSQFRDALDPTFQAAANRANEGVDLSSLWPDAGKMPDYSVPGLMTPIRNTNYVSAPPGLKQPGFSIPSQLLNANRPRTNDFAPDTGLPVREPGSSSNRTFEPIEPTAPTRNSGQPTMGAYSSPRSTGPQRRQISAAPSMSTSPFVGGVAPTTQGQNAAAMLLGLMLRPQEGQGQQLYA